MSIGDHILYRIGSQTSQYIREGHITAIEKADDGTYYKINSRWVSSCDLYVIKELGDPTEARGE